MEQGQPFVTLSRDPSNYVWAMINIFDKSVRAMLDLRGDHGYITERGLGDLGVAYYRELGKEESDQGSTVVEQRGIARFIFKPEA